MFTNYFVKDLHFSSQFNTLFLFDDISIEFCFFIDFLTYCFYHLIDIRNLGNVSLLVIYLFSVFLYSHRLFFKHKTIYTSPEVQSI